MGCTTSKAVAVVLANAKSVQPVPDAKPSPKPKRSHEFVSAGPRMSPSSEGGALNSDIVFPLYFAPISYVFFFVLSSKTLRTHG